MFFLEVYPNPLMRLPWGFPRDAFEWLDNLGNRENLIRVYPHRLLCDALRCYA